MGHVTCINAIMNKFSKNFLKIVFRKIKYNHPFQSSKNFFRSFLNMFSKNPFESFVIDCFVSFYGEECNFCINCMVLSWKLWAFDVLISKYPINPIENGKSGKCSKMTKSKKKLFFREIIAKYLRPLQEKQTKGIYSEIWKLMRGHFQLFRKTKSIRNYLY